MDRITGTLAALALGVGVSLALSGGAVAQVGEEGCPYTEYVEPAGEDHPGAVGSEEYTEITPPTGRDTIAETPDPDMSATAEAVGSVSAEHGTRGGCPEPAGAAAQKTEG
jgi:hypothetical protein